MMEMRCLFGINITGKYFFSAINILPSRSPFIKFRIAIDCAAFSIEELPGKLHRTRYGAFRFIYVSIDKNTLPFDQWSEIVRKISSTIEGIANQDVVDESLAIVRINEEWLFGTCIKSDIQWKFHEYKPHTNSHSLSVRAARALVNIATGTDFDVRAVDPCCGIGTVVIEAASMGIDIKGFEINRKIAEKAAENLSFFGVEDVITCADIKTITDHFDVSLLDLPYGLFTPITVGQQLEIITSARRISDRSVIITFENMDREIEESGFSIIDRGQLSKGKFTRYISVCI